MNKTLEQLQKEQEELQAQMAAIREQQRKAAQEAERIERERKQKEQNDKERAHKVNDAYHIVVELKKLGYTKASYQEGKGANVKICPHGTFDFQHIRIAFDHTGYGRKAKPVITVGGYTPVRFPLKQDNTYSYDKIAKKFDELYKADIAATQRHLTKINNEKTSSALAKKIRNQFNIPTYNTQGVSVKYTPYHADQVCVEFSKTLTYEEACAVLEVLTNLEN